MNGAEWSEISLSPNVLGERGLNLKWLSCFSFSPASLPVGGARGGPGNPANRGGAAVVGAQHAGLFSRRKAGFALRRGAGFLHNAPSLSV